MRRITFSVGVGYGCDLEAARRAIEQALRETAGVMEEPPFLVHVVELGSSSVNFNVYFWTDSHQANVIEVSNRVATAIKLGLDRERIDIPYPHTVVLFHDATGTRPGDRVAGEARCP